MNPDNYGSREACQRLKVLGILTRFPEIGDRVSVDCEGDPHEGFVVNIEALQIEVRFDGYERTEWCEQFEITILYSMAEVWRELPTDPNKMLDLLMKRYGCDGVTFLFQCFFDLVKNIDEAIDLLIWERREKP